MTLNCNFKFLKDLNDNSKQIYACESMNFTNKFQHMTITYVTNLHEMGQRDRDVKIFMIKRQTCHYLPTKIENYFPNVQEIEVDSSGLKQLSRENFASLSRLTMAIFPGNDIEYLPGDLFINNPQLTHIDFSQNKLKLIENHIFNNLHQLRYLMFDDNECYEGYGIVFDEVDIVKEEILRNCSGVAVKKSKIHRKPLLVNTTKLEGIDLQPKLKETQKKDEPKPTPSKVEPTVLTAMEKKQLKNNNNNLHTSSLQVITICFHICTLSRLYFVKWK